MNITCTDIVFQCPDPSGETAVTLEYACKAFDRDAFYVTQRLGMPPYSRSDVDAAAAAEAFLYEAVDTDGESFMKYLYGYELINPTPYFFRVPVEHRDKFGEFIRCDLPPFGAIVRKVDGEVRE